MVSAVSALDVRLAAFTHDCTFSRKDYPFLLSAVLALPFGKSLLQCELLCDTQWIHRKQYVLRFHGFKHRLIEFHSVHGFRFIVVQDDVRFAAVTTT